ncbi:alpha/beta hydrolase [Actinokineospora sp.]|uniref:alpha/beta hydrolase n=1 Tax=Actinokineospora sp. TaxID=1872133 RepID=UPI0040383F5A
MKRTAVVLAAVSATIALAAPPVTAEPGLDWQPCSPGNAAQCATMTVPVDWAKGTGTLELAVSRLPASDPARRIGVLMFNPGGPGAGAAAITSRPDWAAGYFPAEVLRRFDVVGVDFRGTGSSNPIDCARPPHDPRVNRFPTNLFGQAKLALANASFATSCFTRTGPVLAHLDTASVARDLDAVREALGERQISYLGVSYGTMLGQSYAELFPHRLRAFALDAVVDRSLSARQLVEDNAVSTQDGVDQFAAWCARESACALHGKDMSQVLTDVTARADRGEVTVGETALTAREVHAGVTAALNFGSSFPSLAEGLLAASNGDGTGIGEVAATDPAFYRAYRSIICQDMPVDFAARVPETVAKVRALGPDLRGYSEFWDIASGCVGWPLPARWTPRPWQVSPELPPTLLVSGAHDVATPRKWAENVQRQLPGSTLLRWDGVGHASWTANNSCAAKATADYLLTLELPTGTC